MPDACECKHEAKIAMLEQRDVMILESLGKLEQKVDLILMQVTKVAVLEVNHSHQSEALSRAFARIETLEAATKEQTKSQNKAIEELGKEQSKVIEELAKETRAFINEVNGMGRMAKWLWGILTGAVGLLGIKIIFGGG